MSTKQSDSAIDRDASYFDWGLVNCRSPIWRLRAWLLLALLLVARGDDSLQAEPYQSAGTKKMAARLQELIRQADPKLNPFLNRRAAEGLRQELEKLQSQPRVPEVIRRLVPTQYRYASELLNAGENERAIEQINGLNQSIITNRVEMPADRLASLRHMLILAYLRLGEQENCQSLHHSASCLFPITPAGVHPLPRGSRGAIALLNADLEKNYDVKNQWLLNLAYMTLGEYPEQVAERFRINPKLFESEFPLKRYSDIAGGLGLDLDDVAGGVVAEDFNNDGWLDLMISSMGLSDPLRLFLNRGDGMFKEVTAEAGLTGLLGGLNMVQADYNNDGWMDVLVLRGAWFESQGRHPNSLLRNNGNGTFDDVTEEAGILSFHPTQAATWFDFNQDGWIDVFIGNESTATERNPCELFRNNGDGTFTDVAAEVGISAMGMVKAVHSTDYDNDGWPDVYLSLRGQTNFLYRNLGADSPDKSPKGRWKFENVATAAGVHGPVNSFPTWFWDYDNDGWFDLYVSAFAAKDVGQFAQDYLGMDHPRERQRLYRNRGDGTFEDVTRKIGLYQAPLPMSGNFGDLDNDGWLDFYLGTGAPDLAMIVPNRMYRNADGKRFQDVTTSGGFGHLQKGHAIVFADLDHDGDQDIYASMGGAYEGDFYRNVLFENPGNTNRWLKLKLVGNQSNRAAIGARLKLTIEAPSGRRFVSKEVNSGGCFGANPLRQELGLGDASKILELEVWWPKTGKRQKFNDLELDRTYEIREGETEARLTPVKTTPFRLDEARHSGKASTGPRF